MAGERFTLAHRILVLWATFACVVVAASMAVGQGDRPPALVFTEEVRPQEFHDQITLVGRTEAWKTSRLVAEVSGRVARIDAEEGNWVVKGTPLITIDSQRLRLLYRAKEAEIGQVRVTRELARTQLERASKLFQEGLIRQSTLDSSHAWVIINDERYNQLEAEREQMQLDLDRSIVRAPYDGYTGGRLVDVGEWVSPGTPVFEMVDLSRVRVRVDLPERHFGRLSLGSAVTILTGNAELSEIEGVVVGFSPNAKAETHTFPVFIEVLNRELRLGGGMLVTTRLFLDDTFTSLAVSKDAIVRQGMQTLVYAVVDGKAAPVPVQTLSSNGSLVAVKSDGLQEGMQVVIRGNERIFPGSPVTIGNAPPETVSGSVSEAAGQPN